MKVLAVNYRCPAGEADLIALDTATRGSLGAETIAFIEVKTRARDQYTDPAAAVDRDKQRRINKVADYYLARHDADDLNVRFDVVSIVLGAGKPRIDYLEDAF